MIQHERNTDITHLQRNLFDIMKTAKKIYRKERVMEKTNRRTVPRIRTNMIAMIKQDETHQTCHLIDLSIAGACIEGESHYKENEIIDIQFDFSDIIANRKLTLPAMVVWSKEDHEKIRHGLFFTMVNDLDLNLLAHVLHILETQTTQMT